jgi:hypothetical protein
MTWSEVSASIKAAHQTEIEPEDDRLQTREQMLKGLHTKPGTRWEDNPEGYRIAFCRHDTRPPGRKQ